MYELIPIKEQEFDEEWEQIFRNMIAPVAIRSKGRVSADSLLEDFHSGRCQAWAVLCHGVVTTIALTRSIIYRGGRRVFRIDLCSGRLVDAKAFIGKFEDIARELHADAVRIGGRKGWERELDGYKEISRILEREL